MSSELSGLISGTGAKSKIRIVNTVRAEDGCEGYDYYFSAESPDAVMLVEKWASAKQQEAHLQTAHMAELMKIKEKYILNTAVEKAVL